MSKISIASVFLAALSLGGCGLGGQSAVQKAVLAKLENPDGAMFRNEKPGRSGTTCGEVNGKNRAGEYVGFRRFYYLAGTVRISPGAPDFAAALSIQGPPVSTAAACTFALMWSAICTDPSQKTAEAVTKHRCDLYDDLDRRDQLKTELGIK
ncbi:MAG TPA: hypothetical protein VGG10_18660 [Rhizomicrobium sp.]|jgi:hypothetical protein